MTKLHIIMQGRDCCFKKLLLESYKAHVDIIACGVFLHVAYILYQLFYYSDKLPYCKHIVHVFGRFNSVFFIPRANYRGKTVILIIDTSWLLTCVSFLATLQLKKNY